MSKMKTLFVLLLMLICSTGSFAQETTSEIQGVVTDENGKSLAGASVSALHTPTGTSYSTTSRNDGRFNLPNLRIGGPYIIKVTFVGFKESTQQDIQLTLGTAYKADFLLTSNSASLSEVIVSAQRSDKIFSKSRTGSAEVINRQQIDRLPTTNRSIGDFTRLTPTANGSSFGGRSGAYNNLTVNGASFNNTFGLSGSLGGQTGSQPISIDALEQIQVNIAPYDVTLGSFTGAGINSVTKSGTNEFKGAVYTYTKGPKTTGRRVGTTKLARQQFDFFNRGFSIGGPIIKNKLFFFVSAETQQESSAATSRVAARTGLAGDNVSQANALVLDTLRNFLKEKFNYDAGAYENYPFETNSDKITARLDYNINKRNTFNLNYYYLKSDRNVAPSNSGAIANSRQPSLTAMPFFASTYVINNDFNIVIGELNTRFSNKVSNKLQVGYNRLRDYRTSPGGIFPLVDIGNGAGATFTSFGYEPFSAFNQLSTDTWQVNDIVTLFKGKHNITFGTQNTFNKFKNGFAPNYYGAYQFRSLSDFYNSVNNGAAMANRYEIRYSARSSGEFPFAEVSAFQLGFFAQDKFAVTKNFTLTAGLRADIPVFDNFTPNLSADSLTFRNGIKIKTGDAAKTSVLWSPRVGFNWDVNGDKKTQIRGGVGVFAGAPPFVWISNQASNNGIDFGSVALVSGTGAGQTSPTDPRFIFNANVDANRPQNAKANTTYNLAVTAKDFKFPQLFRSNLAIDQKLPLGITATLEGIYSKDINAVYHQNINLPVFGAPLAGPDRRIRYNSSRIYSGAGGATSSNPNITDAILMTNSSKGYTYNLTMQLQRNVKNLYTMLAYSYGDSRSVNDGGSIAQSIWRDRQVAGDPNENTTSYSSFYQPHRVVAAAFYRFEYQKHFATSIGFTFEGANGGTGSYAYSGDVNNDGLNTNDLIYVPTNASEILLVSAPGVATDTRTPAIIWAQLDAYINQDAYLSKRRGQYAERNGLLLPFYRKLDLNFTQDFFVSVKGKRNTLRLTADILNFGNLINPNWGIFKIPNRAAVLNLVRIETTGPNQGMPVYSFPYLNATNQIPLTSTFQNSTAQGSRYQVQFGVRYIFN